MLRFLELSSAPDVSFWAKLSQLKLDEFKLSEDPIPIHGHYRANAHEDVASHLVLTASAFDASTPTQGRVALEGEIRLLNTLESMRTFDRKAAATTLGDKIYEDIISGAAEREPSKLNTFMLICYANLKQYIFYYWLCVPAFKIPSAITCSSSTNFSSVEFITAELASNICDACSDYYQSIDPNSATWIIEKDSEDGERWISKDLSHWKCLECANSSQVNGMLVILDTSNVGNAPGWTARNLLFMCAVRWKLKSVKLLCLREGRSGRFSADRSVIYEIDLPTLDEQGNPSTEYAVVGWEHNSKGSLGPRSINLASTLDPKQRAEAAVDLNLKLMKWRALPELDIDTISKCKCLLLGAGTLGCAVSRVLQGWGCRNITFVDAGSVAYSNPVRQSLFEFEDCLHGGKPKATAAAESLRRIFPGVISKGIQLSIPMPGHSVKDSERASIMDAVATLDSLVKEHDIVFLLTDTRESRWLPTVQALAHGKIAFSVALGFDTFLVIRHGNQPDVSSMESSSGKQLGCYFCNDVAAPLNSTRNRTLDQQCTVVRPGLAFMASALAVELASSVLQHPLKAHAPAPQQIDKDGDKEPSRSILGDIPHSIRGFLDSFSQLSICCSAFPNCVACSNHIIDSYRNEKDRSSFLLKVFNEPEFLENISGLTELKNDALKKLNVETLEGDMNNMEDSLDDDDFCML